MRNKIGLALGSGSARGLANIGILKVLHREGIPINLIAGSSIGALIGAIYAKGVSPEEMEKVFRKLTRRWTITSFFPTPHISGFVGGSMLERFLHIFLEDTDFCDLKIPFSAVATDIETGEEVLLREGSVKKAVRASMSLPVVFVPVHYKERILVDGGLVNPLPVSTARQMGADIIIACRVMPNPTENAKIIKLKRKNWKIPLDIFIRDGRVRFPNMKKMFFQSLSIMENEILETNLQKVNSLITIELKNNHFKPADFHKADEIIKGGEEAAKSVIPALKQILNS